MENCRSCIRAVRRAALALSPAAAAVQKGWKAITPYGVAACWLPEPMLAIIYSPMMIIGFVVGCLVLDFLALVLVAVHWVLGLAAGLAAGIALIIVLVRQGGIAASYPGVADMVTNSIEVEMAGQVKRDFASSLRKLDAWAQALERASSNADTEEATVLALLHQTGSAADALQYMGFKEDSVHPEAPSVQQGAAAPGAQESAPGQASDNPLLFMARRQNSDRGSTNRACILPPRPAVLSLARFVAAARLQARVGTLTPYARRLAHDTAALLTASRTLACTALYHLQQRSTVPLPLDSTLDPKAAAVGAWPATQSALATPQSPTEAAVNQRLSGATSVRDMVSLVHTGAQGLEALSGWLKECPPLESAAGTPWQHLKRTLCIPRCFPSAQTGPEFLPGVDLVDGVRVLAQQPLLAATAEEGGAPSGSQGDAEEDTAQQGAQQLPGSSDDLATGAVEFMKGALDGVLSLVGVAQRSRWAPAGGFDFLRADLQVAHPRAAVMWVDTQGITQGLGLPAARAPCCSDVSGTSCEAWGGVCSPHGRRARSLEAAVDTACHRAFDAAPLLSTCLGTLSCLTCHGFCCRSRGRRLHRRLPPWAEHAPEQPTGWETTTPLTSNGSAYQECVVANVQIGLSAAHGDADDKLLISAIFVPFTAQGADSGGDDNPTCRPVLLCCEPNMGMWEMQQRFSDTIARGHARGMHVLLWNYRGYGLSDGSPSPAAARHDVTAIKAVLLHHPALAGMVGPLLVHGTSIGGLAAAETLAKSSGPDAARPAAAVFDRTFSSLPATAERMVAWWAKPGMHALLPSWALDNTSLFCAATHVPRIISADALNDTIIAWPSSLAASVASTVAAQNMGKALSLAFPGERYPLVLPLLQDAQRCAQAVLGVNAVPALGVHDGLLPSQAEMLTGGMPELNSPRRRSLAEGAAGAPRGDDPEQGTHEAHTSVAHEDDRYHSSPCCHPRARRLSGAHAAGGTSPGHQDAPAAAAAAWGEQGSSEESEPLVASAARRDTAQHNDRAELRARDVLPALGCQLVSHLAQLTQLSSFAIFHRIGPMPLLGLDIYENCHPPCGQERLAADGLPWGDEQPASAAEGMPAHTAQMVSPKWQSCTARPIQCAGRTSSTPPDRLWCVLLPRDTVPAVNDVLWPQPWVSSHHVSQQALKGASTVFHHLHRTSAWRAADASECAPPHSSAVWALQQAAAMSGAGTAAVSAAVQATQQQPRALAVHHTLREFLVRADGSSHAAWSQASQRGQSCALSLGLQGVHPGMGYVVAALTQCWEISNGSWCTLGQLMGEHSHFRGKVDVASFGAWLAAGLVWGWASSDAVLAGPGAGTATASIASAFASLSLAGAVLHLPSTQHAAGLRALRTSISAATDSLNLLAHMVGGFKQLRTHRLGACTHAPSRNYGEGVKQAFLTEGIFLPLQGGHNSPLSPQQQNAIDAILQQIGLHG